MADLGLLTLTNHLKPDELATLVSLGRRQSYRDGQTIHDQGDEDRSMGIVVSGQVKLFKRLPNGHYILEAAIGAGQHFGDTIVLGLTPRTHSSLAVGETVVDHYSKPAFDQLLEHPGILRAFFHVASYRIFRAISLLDDIRTLPPEVRLAKLLAFMLQEADESGQIDCLQEDIAARLGISGVTLAKAFSMLKHEGLVETGYRQVTIGDPERLRQWVAGRTAQ